MLYMTTQYSKICPVTKLKVINRELIFVEGLFRNLVNYYA